MVVAVLLLLLGPGRRPSFEPSGKAGAAAAAAIHVGPKGMSLPAVRPRRVRMGCGGRWRGSLFAIASFRSRGALVLRLLLL